MALFFPALRNGGCIHGCDIATFMQAYNMNVKINLTEIPNPHEAEF
jgi:hypothetical protein